MGKGFLQHHFLGTIGKRLESTLTSFQEKGPNREDSVVIRHTSGAHITHGTSILK